MKPFRIIAALLFLNFCHSFAQTNIGGTLRTDLTLTKVGSPYIVTTNLGIAQGRTLTIEPGATVNFDNASQIIVQGKLIANGTKAEPIIFNGNVKGDAMLQFQKTNLDSSSVTFMRFNGPKAGIKIVSTLGGRLSLKSLELVNSKINGAMVIDVDSSKFINTEIEGLEHIKYCKIDSCVINLFSTNTYSTIYYLVTYIDSSSINGSKIISNIISYNKNGANYFYYSKIYNLNIHYSNFANSTIDCPINYIEIRNSKFKYDSSFIQKSGIIFGNGVILANEFEGNGKMVAIERGIATYTFENNLLFEINNSSFKNFETNIKINEGDNVYLDGLNGNGSGSGPVLIHNNNFLDAPKNYFIENLSIYSDSATSNWWSTTDISVIDSKIYDYWDDILYGEVIYKDNREEPAVVGIKPSEVFKSTVIISPNPFNYEATVENTNSFNGWTMTVLDGSGIEVRSDKNLSGNKIKLSRENLRAGMYFLRLSNEKGNSTTNKIIITD